MIEDSQQPARLTEEECRFIQYFRNLAESEQLILIRQIEEYIIDTEQGENMNKKKTPLPKDF